MGFVSLAFRAFTLASVPFVVPIAFVPFIEDTASRLRSCIAGMERQTLALVFT